MKKITTLWQNVKSYYERSSIQFIMSFSFIAVTVTGILLIGIMFMNRFITSTEDILESNNENVVKQVQYNLENHLHSMRNISNGIYYKIKRLDLAADNDIQNLGDNIRLLYDTNSDNVVSITVFEEKGSLVASEPMSIMKEKVAPGEEAWFMNAINRIENLHFSSPHVQNIFSDLDRNYHWVISLSRSVELNFSGRITRGVLLIDLSFNGIEQILDYADLGQSGYLYLIDSDGELIYHPRLQLINSGLEKENNIAIASYEEGTQRENFDGENRLVTVQSVGYTGWRIVGVSYLSDISKHYTDVLVYTWFMVMFAAAIMILLDTFLTRQITDPIKQLEKAVMELGEGNYEAEIAVTGPYEIRHLAEKMNSMSKQIKRLMEDIVREQSGKRKSEMEALQAQINPHFLYNTLDSIIWMIENERYEGAIEMVTALARLFRISLSKGKNVITISEELEHARNYLIIQKIRYKNKFEYKIEAEPEVLDCMTIKLVIQPFIENAMYHSVEYMVDEGEIWVKAYREEEDVIIDIMDNGPGIPPERLKHLVKTPPKGTKGSGVGIKNVHDRLRLYFGEPYGVVIFSELDEGTTVRIRIPMTYGEKET